MYHDIQGLALMVKSYISIDANEQIGDTDNDTDRFSMLLMCLLAWDSHWHCVCGTERKDGYVKENKISGPDNGFGDGGLGTGCGGGGACACILCACDAGYLHLTGFNGLHLYGARMHCGCDGTKAWSTRPRLWLASGNAAHLYFSRLQCCNMQTMWGLTDASAYCHDSAQLWGVDNCPPNLYDWWSYNANL